jgi:hypothetical protein
MQKKFPVKLSKTIGSRWKLDEFLPKGRFFWIVFDMANGDSGSKRYVWWFDTRKAAREHINHQRDTYGAELSAPHKVEIVGY